MFNNDIEDEKEEKVEDDGENLEDKKTFSSRSGSDTLKIVRKPQVYILFVIIIVLDVQ